MPNRESIGERIGFLAERNHINLRQLAIKADVPYTTLHAIVRRKSNRIQRETLEKIAKALGVTTHFLSSAPAALDPDLADVFVDRVATIISTSDPADVEEVFGNVHAFDDLLDGRMRPTMDDVRDFSDASGCSTDFLLGLTDEPGNKALNWLGEGYTDVDVTLCVLRVKSFIEGSLKMGVCTVEDAEAVTTLILEHIGAENLVPLAKLINRASPEIRRAALAVLNAAAEDGTQVNI